MPPSRRQDFTQNTLSYQTKPRFKWTTISQIAGGKQGGMNAGISLVTTPSLPSRSFVEKKFTRRDILNSTALREIRILHQISDHPHITKLVDHFLDDAAGGGSGCPRASVFLEYCDMGSLMDVVEAVGKGRGKAKGNGNGKDTTTTAGVNEHKLWNWFTQTMDALVYCHRGPRPDDDRATLGWDIVYHRDIKPGNILLKRDVDRNRIIAQLADFGCSISQSWTYLKKPERDVSRASAMTMGFDAPEWPTFNGATDIWQLALTMVCVCTGNTQPRSRQHARGVEWNKERPGSHDYSREYNNILRWCLTSDASQRPTAPMVLRTLQEKYASIKHTLPPDTHPMALVGHTQRPQNQHGAQANKNFPRATPPHLPELQIPRPGLPHVMSEPAPYRNVPNDVRDLTGGFMSPQGPFPSGHSLGRAPNQLDVIPEEENNDMRLHQGCDARFMGGLHPHAGFFPPFHPRGSGGRHGAFGRRR